LSARRLLLGTNDADLVRELQEHPFEPIAETSPYSPPRATIDPDPSKSWLGRAWPVIKTHKGIWSLSLVMSFVALFSQVQIPRYIGNAITDSLPTVGHTTDLKPLTGFATLIFIAIGVREISNYLGRRFLLTTAYSFEYDLRHIIYEHYMLLSFPFYDRVSVGQLISGANSDVRAVQQYLVMAPTVIVQCAVIFVAFAEMFSLNAQLTLVTAISLPITFLVGVAMRKQIYPVSWLIQSRLADIAMLVEENASGVRVVKSFAAEQKELTTLARAADKLQWSYIKDANIRGTWAPTLENLPRVGLAVILLYGGILVVHDHLGVGTLFTFQAYMLIFQPPFRQLGMVIMNGQRAAASAKRIYEVIDQPAEIVSAPGAVDLVECRGDVHFDHVGFAYSDGTQVLNDFNLHMAPGETVAVVGRTGSGKTTAGRLLNRSYDVSEGQLLIDGRDVRDYTLESLRARVGFVFDEPFLFSISIRGATRERPSLRRSAGVRGRADRAGAGLMSMGFGGGPMWGGVSGGGRPGAWGGAGNATQGGAPFAGIPPELQEPVTRLIRTEPDHGEPEALFTQRATDTRPLTLTRMIMDRWRIALLSVIFLTIETVGFQTGPYLTQIGIDDGLVGKQRHLDVIVVCGLVYLVSVVLTVFVERARVRNTGKLAAQVMNDLRVRVYAHIQRLSLDFFTDEKAGVIMTRMTSDIEVLQQLLQDGLAQFAIQGLTMLFVAGVLFSYNWQLALVTLAIVMPALTIASLWFRSSSERSYLRVRDTLAGVISDIAESLSGVRVVASYNRQRNNVVHHRNVLGAYRAANFTTARVTASYSTVSDFVGLVGQASLLLIGGTMVIHSWHHLAGGGLAPDLHPELTIGQLTAFVLYLGSFFQPIQQLVQLYNTDQQGQAAVNKLRVLLATAPTVAEKADAYELPPIQGAITFEDVEFRYGSGETVLSDVDIAIRAGEAVAFVGPTGAGKSTLAKLVTRFYDPTAGRVTIDGHDLTDVTMNSLRRQLGVVPQEPFLFTGTIRDNVAFARPDATSEQVREAIDAVGLDDLIDRLANGLDTPRCTKPGPDSTATSPPGTPTVDEQGRALLGLDSSMKFGMMTTRHMWQQTPDFTKSDLFRFALHSGVGPAKRHRVHRIWHATGAREGTTERATGGPASSARLCHRVREQNSGSLKTVSTLSMEVRVPPVGQRDPASARSALTPSVEALH